MDEQHGGQRKGRPAAFIARFRDMGSANRERYRRALYLREGRHDTAGRWRHRVASQLLLPGPRRADPQRTGVRWPRRCDRERTAGRWWDRTPSSTLLADIPPPRHGWNRRFPVTNVHRTIPRCPSCRGSGEGSGNAASLQPLKSAGCH